MNARVSAQVVVTSPEIIVCENTSVTITATITPSDATGKVQFKNGTTDIGDSVDVASGTASITLTNLPAGSHTINAYYGGDDNNVGGEGSTSITITPAPAATISYASAAFCKSLATVQPVTRTGGPGGTLVHLPV